MELLEGRTLGNGVRVGIVVSRFNDLVTDRLLAGAVDALRRAGVDDEDLTVVSVPGAVEIPVAAARLAKNGAVDAIVTLGAVIRGATDHYDYVCSMVASGVERIALDHDLPVAFGVLTTETTEQALERAGGKAGNKGADAAHAALEMVHLLHQIPGGEA